MKKSLLYNILTRCYNELDKHPEKDNFPHWTFLIKRNRILSVGVNRSAEPSRKFGYHILDASPTFRPKWHSELDSVHRCVQNLHGCIAVNVRLNRHKETRMAFPCKACRNLLKVINCQKVYYTTNTIGTLFESYKEE